MKRKLHYDVILGICILALMTFLYFTSNTFTYSESTSIFPKITIVIISVLAVIVLAEGIKKTLKSSAATDVQQAGPSFLNQYGKPLLVYGLFIVYLLVFYFVNFFVATALMLVGLMFYFGVRSWKTLLFVPVGFLAVAYIVFVNLLSVKLL